jgi:hypothetical protein
MRKKTGYFRLIDPLRPPAPDSEFGQLADLVGEAVTWLFNDPGEGASAVNPKLIEQPSISTVNEVITLALALIAEKKSRRDASTKGGVSRTEGKELVDVFCDRFMARESNYRHRLSSRRFIGQRQILCGYALLCAERVALGLRSGRASKVCDAMRSLLEVVCEVRRTLDREAGSGVKARWARQRWQKVHLVRAKAIELYGARQWNAHQASQKLLVPLWDFAKSEEANLKESRFEQTVYEWLLAYDKERSAR